MFFPLDCTATCSFLAALAFVFSDINPSSETPVLSKCLDSWTTYVLLRPLSSV